MVPKLTTAALTAYAYAERADVNRELAIQPNCTIPRFIRNTAFQKYPNVMMFEACRVSGIGDHFQYRSHSSPIKRVEIDAIIPPHGSTGESTRMLPSEHTRKGSAYTGNSAQAVGEAKQASDSLLLQTYIHDLNIFYFWRYPPEALACLSLQSSKPRAYAFCKSRHELIIY